MDNINGLWDHILEILKTRISKPSFDTWLADSKAKGIEDNIFFVDVTNERAKKQILDHIEEINMFLYDITGEELRLYVNVVRINTSYPDVEKISDKQAKQTIVESRGLNMLNPKYTFDTFVVGAANRFAHAASLAVAETPAKSYNPLFIYGGVGLGKTHLMHAIAHFVQEYHPGQKVMYLSSEKFTNEFINAIMDNKAEAFRNKYRNVDILLIDDIQFLAGKEQTQEEFFHTFNTLHEENKQIIISSDRPPREIPTLEDRLRSRFEWGLITDISPPDLETRIAILTKKAKAEGLTDVPNEVLLYIANQINTNIRELEGALTRVIAYSSLVNQDINTELATEALKDIIPNNQPKKLTAEGIQKFIGSRYNVTIPEFISKKRTKAIAYPRQIAMYLTRELTDLSYPKIGEEFGGRDHTTVIHACKKIDELIGTDEQIKNEIKNYIEKLKNDH